jgi:hypothetical protein
LTQAEAIDDGDNWTLSECDDDDEIVVAVIMAMSETSVEGGFTPLDLLTNEERLQLYLP